ncbi:MAG: hypothetical protein ACLFQZ_11315 [Spirochaetaceae bacterium]
MRKTGSGRTETLRGRREHDGRREAPPLLHGDDALSFRSNLHFEAGTPNAGDPSRSGSSGVCGPPQAARRSTLKNGRATPRALDNETD